LAAIRKDGVGALSIPSPPMNVAIAAERRVMSDMGVDIVMTPFL
jgi:hypothetical protein